MSQKETGHKNDQSLHFHETQRPHDFHCTWYQQWGPGFPIATLVPACLEMFKIFQMYKKTSNQCYLKKIKFYWSQWSKYMHTVFDRWGLWKSSREGPSGAPMPTILSLFLSETISSLQEEKKRKKTMSTETSPNLNHVDVLHKLDSNVKKT